MAHHKMAEDELSCLEPLPLLDLSELVLDDENGARRYYSLGWGICAWAALMVVLAILFARESVGEIITSLCSVAFIVAIMGLTWNVAAMRKRRAAATRVLVKAYANWDALDESRRKQVDHMASAVLRAALRLQGGTNR